MKQHEGRIGYLHVCKPGEVRKPSKVKVYEFTGNQAPIPIESRSGRIGYVRVYEEGEELRQPQFKVGTYENGTFIPQTH